MRVPFVSRFLSLSSTYGRKQSRVVHPTLNPNLPAQFYLHVPKVVVADAHDED